jgi:hypothetical protein
MYGMLAHMAAIFYAGVAGAAALLLDNAGNPKTSVLPKTKGVALLAISRHRGLPLTPKG